MTERQPTDRVEADPDAPWRPGYRGPPPQPRRAERAPWPPPIGCRVLDPWSREAALAEADDPAATHESPATDESPAGDESCDTDEPGGVERSIAGDVSDAATGAGRVAAPAAVVVAGMVILLALAGAVSAVVWLVGGDDHAAAADVRLPDVARELWSADLGPSIADAIVTDDVVVVIGAGRIAGLDHDDGSELWQLDVDVSRHSFASGPVDGVVLVFDVGNARAVAVDVASGTELWTRRVPERRTMYGAHASIVEFGRGVGGGRDVALLEPRTGRRVTERFEIAARRADGRYIPVRVREAIRILDIEGRELVGPELDATSVGPLVSAAVSAGAIVATDADGSLVLFDDTGRVADRIDIDRATRGAVFEVVSVPGADVVAARAESSFGVRATDDRLDVVWSRQRRLESVGSTVEGPRMLLSGADGLTVADALTGADEAGLLRASDAGGLRTQLAGNGVLVRGGDTLFGFDLGGDRRWSIDAGFDRVVAGPDLVVTLRGRTITAFG